MSHTETTTAAAHTPGPWRIEVGQSALSRFQMVVTSKDFAVHYSPVNGDSEDVANARLIAAAPVMHGALMEAAQVTREAFEEALRDVPEGSCVPPWITRLEHAAESAHAALVAADGRFKPLDA